MASITLHSNYELQYEFNLGMNIEDLIYCGWAVVEAMDGTLSPHEQERITEWLSKLSDVVEKFPPR